MLSNLIGLTVFLLVAGVALAVHGREEQRRQRAVERVRRALREQEGSGPDALVDAGLLETQSDLSSVLSEAAQRLQVLRSIDLLLYRAGRPLTLSSFVVASAGLLGLGLFLTAATGVPLLIGLGALPWLVVWQKKTKRMRAFDDQFPQALALFSRALRAGHGLTSGLQMVGESLGDPVGTEFALVAKEISMGLETGTAIANLQDRLDATDLAVFTTAVLVQLETGGNLAEILDNMGDVVRERMLFGGKVRALTSQSRMSANILAGLPFAIAGMIYLFDPGYVSLLWEDAGGRLLSSALVISISIGFILCRRLARVEA
ncbi:MAG: hypothetical protein CL910_21545 [Deltaproteobacteria bacterium]|nr:hypothetical protein [Deltaproteobacteria bacterium]